MPGGRPPKGPKLVAGLEGSGEAKQKLEVIIGTFAGLTIEAACDRLAMSEASIHRLRLVALQGALGALEPKPLGRPKKVQSIAPQVIEELQEKVDTLTAELKVATVKEELELVLGSLQHQGKEAEKKTESSRRHR